MFSISGVRKRNEPYCRIDTSAIASVLLISLLLIQVVIPQPHSDLGRNALLARSCHPVAMTNALRGDALVVSISASGDLYFRNIRINDDELARKIRDGLNKGAEKKVYVIVDARTWYGDIKLVLSEISLAGIEQIGFITREPIYR
jgi:biopolymer transport protein ExbD